MLVWSLPVLIASHLKWHLLHIVWKLAKGRSQCNIILVSPDDAPVEPFQATENQIEFHGCLCTANLYKKITRKSLYLLALQCRVSFFFSYFPLVCRGECSFFLILQILMLLLAVSVLRNAVKAALCCPEVWPVELCSNRLPRRCADPHTQSSHHPLTLQTQSVVRAITNDALGSFSAEEFVNTFGYVHLSVPHHWRLCRLNDGML